MTSLHFTPSDSVDYEAVKAIGFNLLYIDNNDISRQLAKLNSLPTGTKGIVRGYLCSASTEFRNWAGQFAGNDKLFGFYLADEPTPETCPAATIKAQTDWIHANIPDVKTFVVLNEQTTSSNYTAYANAVDFLGLDPYPCVPWETRPNCGNAEYVTKVITAALDAGVPREKVVPVYQAAEWPNLTVLPTVEQERLILAAWGAIIPDPVFDCVYTWKHYGETTTLKDSLALQKVFRSHFAREGIETKPPTIPANLLASVVSTSQINLAWTASTDNGKVTGYEIFRDGAFITRVTGTSHQNKGLGPDTTYSYQVRAMDAAGNVSARTGAVSAKTASGETPLPNPTAWWKLDDNAGTAATDSSGNTTPAPY